MRIEQTRYSQPGFSRRPLGRISRDAGRFTGLFARFAAALVVASALPAYGSGCDDLTLRPEDLDLILKAAIRPVQPLVESHWVDVVAGDSCYVRIGLRTKGLPPIIPACDMRACSVADFAGTRIALHEFDIQGCDSLFRATGISRHVPTAYAEVKDRITEHCGSPDWRIVNVFAVQTPNGPAVRVRFASQ